VFCRYISVHRTTITRCEKDIKAGRNEAVHGNVGSSKTREKALEAEAWLSQYAQASGDFLPHKKQIQLPEYSFEHLYERYVEEFRKRADQEGFGLFVRVSPKALFQGQENVVDSPEILQVLQDLRPFTHCA
jgi:hypothetical protein